MANLKEFTLLEGETIVAQIEGNAWNTNPNPIAQLIAGIAKIFWAILGIKLKTHIVATNLRIVRIDKKTILWGMLPGAATVLTLNKSTIQSVGYAMRSSWFIFRKHYFLLANMSAELQLTYSGSKKDLVEACRLIDGIVTQK